MSITDIIARLEVAMDGSRELDSEIYIIVHKLKNAEVLNMHNGDMPADAFDNDIEILCRTIDGHAVWIHAPPYTTSIDTAITLIRDDMPLEIHIGPGRYYTEAAIFKKNVTEDEQGRRVTQYQEAAETIPIKDGTLRRNTPALAICIVALKARV